MSMVGLLLWILIVEEFWQCQEDLVSKKVNLIEYHKQKDNLDLPLNLLYML